MTWVNGDGEQPPHSDAEVEEVAIAVMAASRLLVAVSARALASVDAGLTLPQLRTLVVLDGCGPVKLAELATSLGVNPSTAMRMVDRLEMAGLMDRKANATNRREVVLRLTPAGRELVAEVIGRRQAEIRRLVARLPAVERAGLVSSLHALIDAGDEMDGDPYEAVRSAGGLLHGHAPAPSARRPSQG